MKTSLLFVMNNLNCGGAEKALLSLLETIDYSRFEVDLYLFKHEGIFLRKLPKEVRLLPEPVGFRYFDMPVRSAMISCLRNGRFRFAFERLLAGFVFKTERNPAKCEQRVWKYLSKTMQPIPKTYDAAIGYLEKNPIYFCAEKVNAARRIGFIHNDYEKLGMDPTIDDGYFSRIDNLVTVSAECANVLKNKFPQYVEKVTVMHNIVSPRMIDSMAMEPVEWPRRRTTIVTVGRLHAQKGLELAIDACDELVRRGRDIVWYVIGEGEERERLERHIRAKNLQDSFMLPGLKENPYPYIREADIYVQPSRFEGKSIAIDEAKILCKPIVVTNFSTAKDQIEDGVNGLIVGMDPQSIAEGIERILRDDALRAKLVNHLASHDFGTEAEIETFYSLVNK